MWTQHGSLAQHSKKYPPTPRWCCCYSEIVRGVCVWHRLLPCRRRRSRCACRSTRTGCWASPPPAEVCRKQRWRWSPRCRRRRWSPEQKQKGEITELNLTNSDLGSRRASKQELVRRLHLICWAKFFTWQQDAFYISLQVKWADLIK